MPRSWVQSIYKCMDYKWRVGTTARLAILKSLYTMYEERQQEFSWVYSSKDETALHTT